jgi:hypothetical protein
MSALEPTAEQLRLLLELPEGTPVVIERRSA